VRREGQTKFAIQAKPGSDGLTVVVSGEIDIAVADRLFDTVLAQLPDEPVLVLDLAGVTFCDSSGIRTLVRLHDHQAEAGRTMRLVNTSDVVRRVLEASGLSAFFGIDDPHGLSSPEGDGAQQRVG
jgi:anti-sigma B factor antagonist